LAQVDYRLCRQPGAGICTGLTILGILDPVHQYFHHISKYFNHLINILLKLCTIFYIYTYYIIIVYVRAQLTQSHFAIPLRPTGRA